MTDTKKNIILKLIHTFLGSKSKINNFINTIINEHNIVFHFNH